MSYRALLHLALLSSSVLLLVACSLRPVQVVQEQQFTSMCKRLGPEMLRRSLLDEQGNYLAPLSSTSDSDHAYGSILFRRLSPSFRYAAQETGLPSSFAEGNEAQDVQLGEKGFKLRQGLNTVEMEMIAVADWEGNGNSEWLASCKIVPEGSLASRTYYLAIAKAPDELAPLVARVLAVYDCENFVCTLYSGSGGAQPYAPEAAVIESMPGQRKITSPPAKNTVRNKALPAQKQAGP